MAWWREQKLVHGEDSYLYVHRKRGAEEQSASTQPVDHGFSDHGFKKIEGQRLFGRVRASIHTTGSAGTHC